MSDPAGNLLVLIGTWLTQLALAAQKCLQFLNALSLSCKQPFMLFVRQNHKIRWTIIMGNPIEVMNNPVGGHTLTVRHFPVQDMFSHIAMLIRSWVVGHIDQAIPVLQQDAAFPSGIARSPGRWAQHTNAPSVLHPTWFTSRSSAGNQRIAIYAMPLMLNIGTAQGIWSFRIAAMSTT